MVPESTETGTAIWHPRLPLHLFPGIQPQDGDAGAHYGGEMKKSSPSGLVWQKEGLRR